MPSLGLTRPTCRKPSGLRVRLHFPSSSLCLSIAIHTQLLQRPAGTSDLVRVVRRTSPPHSDLPVPSGVYRQRWQGAAGRSHKQQRVHGDESDCARRPPHSRTSAACSLSPRLPQTARSFLPAPREKAHVQVDARLMQSVRSRNSFAGEHLRAIFGCALSWQSRRFSC